MAGILLNRNRQVPAEETPAFGGIAERFRRAGDLDRAIALCRDGLKRFPDQLSARVTLGWSLLDKGQYEAARAELEQVLRRAPDNLAAIRGLAELHDRSEGAMSSDAEQESWRSAEAAAALAEAHEAVAAEPAADLLAPIPVALGNGADENDTPEVLHTAAQSEQLAEAALSTFEPAADLVAAPVELEDAAAASMAASDPAPFFVVDPEEAVAASAIETTIQGFEAVDLDTGVAAAGDALLAGAAVTADWDDAADLIAGTAAAAGLVLGDEASSLDVHTEAASATDWALDQPVETMPLNVVETLEDVDEEVGQELADAIKALEAATRRVEAKFAVPPSRIEPAASAEEIAAFEFLDSAGNVVVRDGARDAAAAPVVDARHDGAFELAAPDLASLNFDTESEPVAEIAAGDTVDALAAALDFAASNEAEEAAEAAAAAEAEAEWHAAQEAARLEAERQAAEEAARLEAERQAAEEAARLEAERQAAEEAARLEAERQAAEEAARLEAERQAAEEAARLEAERQAAEEAARLEAERQAAEEAARLEAERQAAEEAARLETERQAAEEAARLEAERQAAEEAARLEAERQAAEEAARLEAERQAAEEAARLEAERQAAEQAARLEAERQAAAAASDRDEPPAAAAGTGKRGLFAGWFGRNKKPAVVEPAAGENAPDADVAEDAGELDTRVAALVGSDPAPVEPAITTGAVVDAIGAETVLARPDRTLAALERFLRQVQARQMEIRSQVAT